MTVGLVLVAAEQAETAAELVVTIVAATDGIVQTNAVVSGAVAMEEHRGIRNCRPTVGVLI